MTGLITIRAIGAGDTEPAATAQARCSLCGEEVYVASSSRRLLREYDIDIICTVCIAQKGGLMPHKRLFDPKFFNKHKTIQLCLKEKYLYLAMKAHADDDGRLIGHPAYLQTIAFLYDNISINRIRAFRDHVIEVDPENLGLMLYRRNEAEYIVFEKFKDEQKPKHYLPSDLPSPPGEYPLEELGSDDDGGPESAPISPQNGSGKGPESPPESPPKGPQKGPKKGPDRGQKGAISGDISAPKSSQKAPLGLGEGLGGELTHTHTSYSLTPRASQSENAVEKQTPERKFSRKQNGDEKGKVSEKKRTPERGISPEEPLQNVEKSKPANQTKNRMKPHQKKAGMFLDSVEKHKNIRLLQREKLLHIVRKLFWIEGTTPQKLLQCFLWLEENDLFCRGKEPPLIITKMPDKYPSWLQGKLPKYEPEESRRRPDGEPGKDSAKARRKQLEPIESGPDDQIEPGVEDGGNGLSDVPKNFQSGDKNLHDPAKNQRDPPS